MKQYWYQAWYVLFQQPFSIQICWHNIKQDCYHDVLLEQHCSRLFVHQPWTVLFHACWQLAIGCAFFLFLRVLITNSPLRRNCDAIIFQTLFRETQQSSYIIAKFLLLCIRNEEWAQAFVCERLRGLRARRRLWERDCGLFLKSGEIN